MPGKLQSATRSVPWALLLDAAAGVDELHDGAAPFQVHKASRGASRGPTVLRTG